MVAACRLALAPILCFLLTTTDALAKKPQKRTVSNVQVEAWARDLQKDDPQTFYAALSGLAEIQTESILAREALIRRANHGDQQNRLAAIHRLAENPCERVADALLALVDDPIHEIRLKATYSLGNQCEFAKPALPRLLCGLRSNHREFADACRWTIEQVPSHAAELVPELLEMTKDKDIDVARRAASVLGEIGLPRDRMEDWRPILLRQELAYLAALGIANYEHEAASFLPDLHVALMSEADSYCRACITFAIAAIGPSRSSIPALLYALRDRYKRPPRQGLSIGPDDRWIERGDPQKLLVQLGRDAVLDLVSALQDKDNAYLCEVLETLGLIGAAAEASVPAIVGVIRDEAMPMDVRRAAIEAFGRIGVWQADALEALRSALRHEHLREGVLTAMTRIGPTAAGLVPEVVELLATAKDDRTYYAVTAIGAMGPAGRAAAPALARRLKAANQANNFTAVALWRVARDPAALDYLTRQLKDPNSRIARYAAMDLGQCGPEATAALPALWKATGHDMLEVRAAAAAAIWRMTEDPDAMAGLLRECLAASWAWSDQGFKQVARLLRLGVPALPILTAGLIEDPRALFEWTTLMQIGVFPGELVGYYAGQLNDKSRGVRITACRILGDFGGYADGAIPALIAAARDSDAGVGKLAVQALFRINPMEARKAGFRPKLR